MPFFILSNIKECNEEVGICCGSRKSTCCQSTNQRARFHNSSVNRQNFMLLLLFRSAARAFTLLNIFLHLLQPQLITVKLVSECAVLAYSDKYYNSILFFPFIAT